MVAPNLIDQYELSINIDKSYSMNIVVMIDSLLIE